MGLVLPGVALLLFLAHGPMSPTVLAGWQILSSACLPAGEEGDCAGEEADCAVAA